MVKYENIGVECTTWISDNGNPGANKMRISETNEINNEINNM